MYSLQLAFFKVFKVWPTWYNFFKLFRYKSRTNHVPKTKWTEAVGYKMVEGYNPFDRKYKDFHNPYKFREYTIRQPKLPWE